MRTLRLAAVLPVALLALARPTPAGSCSGATGTLTVTPDACVQAGDTISVTVCNGAPGALALVAISDAAGSTSFGPFGPFPAVTLCLEAPFGLLPLGLTDASGCADVSVAIPAGAPLPGDVNLTLQGLLIGFSFSPPSPPTFGVSTTNTDSLCL